MELDDDIAGLLAGLDIGKDAETEPGRSYLNEDVDVNLAKP